MFNMSGCLLLLALLIFPGVSRFIDTTIASGSTNCVHDALCKVALGHTDGFSCKPGFTSSSGEPVACDLLNVLYDRWEAKAKVISHLFKEVGKIRNATRELLTDLQILKGRQVVSGGVQGVQVFMSVAYLITISVLCVVKYCNKRRESVAQEEFELLEARLQASKAKRRAAAARAQPEITSRPNPSQK
jgi:hypothetical protein